MWVDEEIHALCIPSATYKNFCVCPVCDSVSLFMFYVPSPTLSLVAFLSGSVVRRDLSNNQISELASDAFQGLRSLNSLWVLHDVFVFSVYTKHPFEYHEEYLTSYAPKICLAHL